MGIISIAINTFTILLVGVVFYITFLAFGVRTDKNETWLSTFKKVWSSPSSLNSALSPTSSSSMYGNLGAFVGQDWAVVDSIPINEADSQDSLEDFMETVHPNRVGTKKTV